ncbi:hypothetical protein SAMN05421781_1836 [Marinococcus luteus]|uniref:Uncharacterized protein n=1 Tax=Marinococcus luteus TaxID=1122204 RepID=A0A1H2UQE8_9BACI|nr:hypothetical protein [Marinococcus luteus]SDW58300.1 hypothetical protein SAMN05421781_1836 [Marinococcus luteus]
MRAEKSRDSKKRFSAAGHKEHIIVEPVGFVNGKACKFRGSGDFKVEAFD